MLPRVLDYQHEYENMRHTHRAYPSSTGDNEPDIGSGRLRDRDPNRAYANDGSNGAAHDANGKTP